MADFSVDIINTLGKYTKGSTLESSARQLLKSATSIGANYTEANNASSKDDFRHKVSIAKKEAAETRYWLKILSRTLPDEDLSGLQQEALELNLILQKIITTMKNGK